MIHSGIACKDRTVDKNCNLFCNKLPISKFWKYCVFKFIASSNSRYVNTYYLLKIMRRVDW